MPDSSSSSASPPADDGAVRRARRLMDLDDMPVPPETWEPPGVAELQALLPDYEFLSLIGRGGMGAVYKARQISLDRSVAVKVLPLGDDPEYARRFRNEARLLARMNHPGIVHVYDFGNAGETMLYFVMEYVDGTDVAQMVAGNGRLTMEHAVSITADVCAALHYAHSHGVVHRDVKPANVLVTREGQVKVADFGIARNQESEGAALTTSLVPGTPEFAAPETLMSGVVVDHRADIYAVGVMLYNMLTGEIPRGVFPPLTEKIQAPPEFDEVIRKAMAADREKRYQTAQALKTDIQKAGSVPVMRRRQSWWRRPVWRAAAVVAVLAGLMAVMWPRSRGGEDNPSSPQAINATPADKSRAAAEWAISLGGGVIPAGYQGGVIKSVAALPPGELVLDSIIFEGVNSGSITDADMRRVIPEMKSLSRLVIRDSPDLLKAVSRDGLKALATMYQLESLALEGAPIKDDDLFFLSGLPLLRELNLSHTGVTGAGLSRVRSGLERLEMRGCPVSEEGAREIGALKNLAVLDIRESTATGACLRLLRMPGLKEISIAGTSIPYQEFRTLRENMPGIRLIPDPRAVEHEINGVPSDSIKLNLLMWGFGSLGQLGMGLDVRTSGPELMVPVQNFPAQVKVVQADVYYHGLALLDTGEIAAWGMNNFGQCEGLADPVWRPRVIQVNRLPAGDRVVSVAQASDSSYAILASGNVYAWGTNRDSHLGDGTQVSRSFPARVLFPEGVRITQIATGWLLMLALTDDGRLFKWGTDLDGRHAVPVDVTPVLPAGDKIKALANSNHRMVLMESGRIFCWGSNQSGQLGDGTTIPTATPVEVRMDGVLAGVKVREIHAGYEHSVAVSEDGRVFAWGRNNNGNLGDGTSQNSAVPVEVQFTGPLAGRRVASMAVANDHSLAMTTEGELIFWGGTMPMAGEDTASTAALLAPGVQTPARQPVKLDGILPAGRKVKKLLTGSHCGLLLLE